MTKSSERIEEEIDGIRDRMRSRIDSATREMTPKALAARLTGKEDPSTGELVEWAIQKAKTNPLATSLIAAGVIGLAVQSNDRTRVATSSDVRRQGSRIRSYADGATEAAKGYVHDAADIAVEKADDAAHYIREKAGDASRSINRTAHDAERAARRAADRSVDVGREGADWVKRNPTATGLFALAIGAAAASVFAARRDGDPVLKSMGWEPEEDDVPAPPPTRPARRSPATAKPKPVTGAAAAKPKKTKTTTAASKADARKANSASGTTAKPKQPRAAKPKPAGAPSPKPSPTPAASSGSTSTTPVIPSTPERDTQVH